MPDGTLHEVLQAKVAKYIEIEEKALSTIRIAVPENSLLMEFASSALTMIRAYFSDAIHFKEKGDLVNSFAALNYSYGWIDSLVRLGVLDGKGDDRLFTLYR